MTNADAPLRTLLTRLGGWLPPRRRSPLLRWRRRGGRAGLEPANPQDELGMDDLLCVERQKTAIKTNTLQFINRLPANNALLWGPRGTGKSSLVKALLREYRDQDLRLVEVARDNLADLLDIGAELARRDGRFIIYCDDLSFDANDSSYKTLKAQLDGWAGGLPENALIYATSNRRHLLPEFMAENLEAAPRGGEIHPGEAVEEKLSLSERFGLWLAFHPFNQEQYLEIAFHWLEKTGVPLGDREQVRRAALQWALEKGGRSGRAAAQFARDWAGKALLEQRRQTRHG